MNKELFEYIEHEILPRYEKFYSHGLIHINQVRINCKLLADYYHLDQVMCDIIAIYHDLGLKIDRNHHEIESGKIFIADLMLKKHFTRIQLEIMKEAIEDHRGSRKERPRNFYGEVLSDSDRDFDIEVLAKRQLATSLKNNVSLKNFEEHFEFCYNYLLKRINENGHFNLWTNNPILIERRAVFESQFLDKPLTRSLYKKEYEQIASDGTLEKILNYYEDY